MSTLFPGRQNTPHPRRFPGPTPYAAGKGERYVLPTTLLHHGGLYEYVLIDLAQARRWLEAGPWRSWLTHPMLHEAFERLFGALPPPAKGPLPQLGYHDDALCFLVEGYETLPDLRRGDSHAITRLVEKERFTLGLLRRLA